MSSLHRLQTQFAESLFDPACRGMEAHIRPNGLSAGRRIQVYRNNVRASLSEALGACFPVIKRLVGERFFDYAAGCYLCAHSSRSGNLHDFGREFPAFIERFEPALCYLPDVARLEWAYQEVFHAAEAPPLDLRALSSVPPDRYGELRFALHPASRLLASPYPVLRIWGSNQSDYAGDGRIDLSEGGVRVLVIRRDLEIEMEALSAGEYALLRAMAQGRMVSDASTEALEAEPDLDLPACLRRHLARRTLVRFWL